MSSGEGRMFEAPSVLSEMLQHLRIVMKNPRYVTKPLQAYIITSCDAHQSEYLAECEKRIAFITGFTGSAGTAIVTEDHARLWTDGRYYLQASKQMESYWTLMKEGVPSTPTQGTWLVKNLSPGSRVGTDPALMSYSMWKTLQTQLETAGISLVAVAQNLIDLIWDERSEPPFCYIEPLPIRYTGKTSKTKVDDIRKEMVEKGATLLVLTALDEIAWLLNLRGADIQFNPVFYSYVLVTPGEIHLFVDESKLQSSVEDHFQQEGISVQIDDYGKMLEFFTQKVTTCEGKVWIGPGSSYALHDIVPEKHRLCEITPVAVMKALKNPVEKQGMINAHIRDAAALCCYFSWLEKEVPKGGVTEISGAKKLESFRAQQEDYVGLSFTTISSSGPNGSIIHYTPEIETNRPVTTEELYLCDSGAQYKDGTTDVTRTLHFGTPTQYEKECFTRVFKGQFNLGTCVFPNKIVGNCLDTLARKALWDVGLDYLHGTGHGIGMYLNVHEGPMGISWRPYPTDPGLQEGMFLSNEPGYYEDGKFGIRLENIVVIIPASVPFNFKDRGALTFQTVTLVPIQTKMLVPEMLTQKEITYLNEYHNECREKVGAVLKKLGHTEALEWLFRETEPIG